MTQEDKPFVLPPRNPKTHARHRQDVIWQITVPVMIAFIIVLGLSGVVIWSCIQAKPEVSRWADASLIWLSVPAIITAFIFLLLLSGITFGIIMLIQVLPGYARLVQDFFLRLQIKVLEFSNRLVRPLITIRGYLAGLRELRRQLSRRDR